MDCMLVELYQKSMNKPCICHSIIIGIKVGTSESSNAKRESEILKKIVFFYHVLILYHISQMMFKKFWK